MHAPSPQTSVQSYRTLLEFASCSGFSQPFNFCFPIPAVDISVALAVSYMELNSEEQAYLFGNHVN